MSHTKIETLVTSAGIVGAADQIMKGMESHDAHQSAEARSHYIKAAIAGAIAIGAYEMLRRDEDLGSDVESPGYKDKNIVCSCSGASPHAKGCPAAAHTALVVNKKKQDHKHHANHEHHLPTMLSEVAGAYAMGRQLLGHREHRIMKLVAEGLGAAALAKDVNHHVVD